MSEGFFDWRSPGIHGRALCAALGHGQAQVPSLPQLGGIYQKLWGHGAAVKDGQ